ncbi:hypothetical protein FVEN_g12627 [Fusarium venenatum]|uniref:Uncharacterized protein n=1 Tax=Fusarium venenatum TaxID=56646 RepID=A0A2L2T4Z8_9HYPO|nr:uncharacterized protein FVRRES_07219 [Fusarium venenatum]KAG8362403.1 hypothetical protein FVEN_g12627 [Fusarium venenatum]KAH6994152.1 hypothetical protein EDB82DRAFT_185244 [Fusarium venenatum]CEI62783.1 unnamed protein product [Fusarium venenatum]
MGLLKPNTNTSAADQRTTTEESLDDKTPNPHIDETSAQEVKPDRKERRKLRSRLRSRHHASSKTTNGRRDDVDLTAHVVVPAPSTLDWVTDWDALKTPLITRQGDVDTQSICVCEDIDRRTVSEP